MTYSIDSKLNVPYRLGENGPSEDVGSLVAEKRTRKMSIQFAFCGLFLSSFLGFFTGRGRYSNGWPGVVLTDDDVCRGRFLTAFLSPPHHFSIARRQFFPQRRRHNYRHNCRLLKKNGPFVPIDYQQSTADTTRSQINLLRPLYRFCNRNVLVKRDRPDFDDARTFLVLSLIGH